MFEQQYWQENYAEPQTMDGVVNAGLHASYCKAILKLEEVKVSSLIDLGFGMGHMLESFARKFKVDGAAGIEPSRHMFKRTHSRLKTKGGTFKLSCTDLYGWCQKENSKKYDLGICTSVMQYVDDDHIEEIFKVMASRIRFLYFSVPTKKELERQVKDFDFKDRYALGRSKKTYRAMIKKHFTIVSSRILESKYFFSSEDSPFSDFLFRF